MRIVSAVAALVIVTGGLAGPGIAAQSPWEVIKKKIEETKKKVAETTKKKGAPPPTATAKPNAPDPGQPGSSEAPPSKLATSSAKVEEHVLVTGQQRVLYIISPRGQRFAAIVLRGSRNVVVHDGVDGPRFDQIVGDIGGLSFSPDGNRLAYIGRLGQEYVYVVDGKELMRLPLATHPNIRGGGEDPALPRFTSNSRHVYFQVYTAKSPSSSDQWWNFVWDGQLGPESQKTVVPVFSPDGERHAYLATNRQNWDQQILIVDGKPAGYVGGEPQFTADSLRLITKVIVPRAGAVDVLVDGKPFIRAPGGIQLYLPPVGPGLLAAVQQPRPQGDGSSFLLIGNKKVPGSECPGTYHFNAYFSPDGKHWAAKCVATPTSHWLIVDGKKAQEYEGISSVTFTEDGRVLYKAGMGGKLFLVHGDQESEAYADIRGPHHEIVDPANPGDPLPAVIGKNRIGFTSATSGTRDVKVVIDGKEIVRRSANGLQFSPDTTRYAFAFDSGISSGGGPLHVDGVDYSSHVVPFQRALVRRGPQWMDPFLFSPDSKHIVHFGHFGAPQIGTFGVVIDGKHLLVPGGGPMCAMFTPDSRHLMWLDRTPDRPQLARLTVFVDGRPAAEIDLPSGGQTPGWIGMGDDGVLTLIAQDGDSMKRFRITPGNDTSIDTMLAAAKPVKRGT
jgi:hypothetical protein